MCAVLLLEPPRHCIVQSLERGFVPSLVRCQPQVVYRLHADLGRRGVGLQNSHHFRDEVLERHGAWVFRAVHQVSLHIRRNQLQHFDRRATQLVAQRLRVGVDGRLGGAVGGRKRQRNKRQA